MCTAYTFHSSYDVVRPHTVKNGLQFSRPPPGCHWPNSLWAGIIKVFPGQGEFGQWHPGWGRENCKPFFTVQRTYWRDGNFDSNCGNSVWSAVRKMIKISFWAISQKIKKLGIPFGTIFRREKHSELYNSLGTIPQKIKMLGIPFLIILHKRKTIGISFQTIKSYGTCNGVAWWFFDLWTEKYFFCFYVVYFAKLI